MGVGREEPAAEHRAFAHVIRQQYLALIQEGFSEQQTLAIIGQMMAAALSRRETDE